EKNLFEFDCRRDAPTFYVLLSRHGMCTAKQHHQKQYKPYHRLFPSRIEETTPPRIAREARGSSRCSQLRALAQPVASRTPPLASKPDNSTDETAFRFPPAPAGCRRPCATSAAPHGRS